MVGAAAKRASRAPAWGGLGHIPVLLTATTAAAVMVPVTVAKLPFGYGLATVALAVLAFTTLAGMAGGARLVGRRTGRVSRAPARLGRLAAFG